MKRALYLISSLLFVLLRLISASESIDGIMDGNRSNKVTLQQDISLDSDEIILEPEDRQLVVDVVFFLTSRKIENIQNGVRLLKYVNDYDLFFENIQYNIEGERLIPLCAIASEARLEVFQWFIQYLKTYFKDLLESFYKEYQITSCDIDFVNVPVDLIRLKMIHHYRNQLFNLMLENNDPNGWNYYVQHKIAMYQGLMDKIKKEMISTSLPEDVARAVYQILFSNVIRIEEFEYEASREEEFERLSKFSFEFDLSDSGTESFKTANENGDNEDSANESESGAESEENVQEIVSEFVNRIRDAAINSTYELISEESSEAKVPARVSNETYDEVVSLSPSDNEDEETVQSEQTEDESIYRIQHNNTPITLSISGSDDESITVSVQDSEYSEIEDGVSVDAFDNEVAIPGITETNEHNGNSNETDPLVEGLITEPLLMDVTEDVQVETQEHNALSTVADTSDIMEEDNAYDERPAENHNSDTMEIEIQAGEGEERANIEVDTLVNPHTAGDVPSETELQPDHLSETNSVAPVTYINESTQVDPVNNALIELIQDRGIVEIRNDPEERDSGSEVEERKSESSIDDDSESVFMTLADLFTLSHVPDTNEVKDTDTDDSSSFRSSDCSTESSLYDEKGTIRALKRAEKRRNRKIVRPTARKDSSDSENGSDSSSNSESSSSSITSTNSTDPNTVVIAPVVTSQQSLKHTATNSSFNVRNTVIVVVAVILIASVIGLGWMMYQRIDLEEEEKQ